MKTIFALVLISISLIDNVIALVGNQKHNPNIAAILDIFACHKAVSFPNLSDTNSLD
jgi:hypothetical protein